MGFQDEMKQMFLRIAAGDVEPEEWETWWNSNRLKLEETLTRGDRGRIMPALWSANYYWMTKTQGGVAYYFHTQGRPVKTSGYYAEKAQEEKNRDRQKAMEVYHRKTAPARRSPVSASIFSRNRPGRLWFSTVSVVVLPGISSTS